MTPLRKRMIEEMGLRNFAPYTVTLYVDNVARFAKHFGKSTGLRTCAGISGLSGVSVRGREEGGMGPRTTRYWRPYGTYSVGCSSKARSSQTSVAQAITAPAGGAQRQDTPIPEARRQMLCAMNNPACFPKSRRAHFAGMTDQVLTSRQRWRQIVERQVRSGISVTAFCRQNQIAVSSFFAWKPRLRSARPRFVEVKTAGADGAAVWEVQHSWEGIEVLLHGGRSIRVRSGLIGRWWARSLPCWRASGIGVMTAAASVFGLPTLAQLDRASCKPSTI